MILVNNQECLDDLDILLDAFEAENIKEEVDEDLSTYRMREWDGSLDTLLKNLCNIRDEISNRELFPKSINGINAFVKKWMREAGFGDEAGLLVYY